MIWVFHFFFIFIYKKPLWIIRLFAVENTFKPGVFMNVMHSCIILIKIDYDFLWLNFILIIYIVIYFFVYISIFLIFLFFIWACLDHSSETNRLYINLVKFIIWSIKDINLILIDSLYWHYLSRSLFINSWIQIIRLTIIFGLHTYILLKYRAFDFIVYVLYLIKFCTDTHSWLFF